MEGFLTDAMGDATQSEFQIERIDEAAMRDLRSENLNL